MDAAAILILAVMAFLSGIITQTRYGYRSRKRLDIESVTDPEKLPYQSSGYILSEGELRFYKVLKEAVGESFHICPKVRIADVIRCSDEDWKLGYGSAIAQKHLDFVLVFPKNMRIACAVELDDSSHDKPARRRRDAFVDAAMKSAGVQLVHRKVTKEYDIRKLQSHIWKAVRERSVVH